MNSTGGKKGLGGGGGGGLKGCYATVAKTQDSFQNMKKYGNAGIKALKYFLVVFALSFIHSCWLEHDYLVNPTQLQ